MTKFALFAAGKDVRNLANSGDADAMYQLGLMYESGADPWSLVGGRRNVTQNMPIALNRFRQAADKGHEKATEKLEQLSGKYNLAPYIPKSPEPEEEEE